MSSTITFVMVEDSLTKLDVFQQVAARVDLAKTCHLAMTRLSGVSQTYEL